MWILRHAILLILVPPIVLLWFALILHVKLHDSLVRNVNTSALSISRRIPTTLINDWNYILSLYIKETCSSASSIQLEDFIVVYAH